MVKLITYLREHPEFLKNAFFGLLSVTLVFDFFAEKNNPHFFGDTINCFWALFSALGSLLMIVLCRGIYRAWLMRGADYYDS